MISTWLTALKKMKPMHKCFILRLHCMKKVPQPNLVLVITLLNSDRFSKSFCCRHTLWKIFKKMPLKILLKRVATLLCEMEIMGLTWQENPAVANFFVSLLCVCVCVQFCLQRPSPKWPTVYCVGWDVKLYSLTRYGIRVTAYTVPFAVSATVSEIWPVFLF